MIKKVIAIAVSLCLSACNLPTIAPSRYEATFYELFDTVTTIVGYADTEKDFNQDIAAFYDKLSNYHQLYDIYNDYPNVTNLKTLNDTASISPVRVDSEIIAMLNVYIDNYEMIKGAASPSMGAVLSLWHEAREGGTSLPNGELLEQAKMHTDINSLVIDEQSSTVYFSDPLLKLDVGAVAKGYALEQSAKLLPEGYLVSVGGNIIATGRKPLSQDNEWILGLQNPYDGSDNFLHKLKITDEAIVTSGDYQRYYEVDGIKYHHIIDPATSYPADDFHAVTVIASSSAMADLLSTALFVLPLEEGRAIVEGLDDVEAVWTIKEEESVYSSNFFQYISE